MRDPNTPELGGSGVHQAVREEGTGGGALPSAGMWPAIWKNTCEGAVKARGTKGYVNLEEKTKGHSELIQSLERVTVKRPKNKIIAK